ncbi:MAG: hypothetical protein AB7L94_33415 [Kofleriaceae bacterium]
MRLALVWILVCGCGAEYGERCQTDDDCAEPLECYRSSTDPGYCMPICRVENNFTCPAQHVCSGPRDLFPKPCVKTCEDDADCPDTTPECGVGLCTIP